MEWKGVVVADDGELHKSLQFAGSVFWEACPIDVSVLRPAGDSAEKANWACSLSTLSYAGELHCSVLIEPTDLPAGCGPLQVKENFEDAHGEIIGETRYRGNSETNEFRVRSHWAEPNRFVLRDFKLEEGTFLPPPRRSSARIAR